jgi:hypothetical protein
LKDAPCGNTLTELISEHGLTLSAAQQLNLVGPGGTSNDVCGLGSNFEDLVKAEILKECFDEGLIDFFVQTDIPLNIYNDMCDNSDSGNPITCNDCTPTQLQQVEQIHQAAITQLNCAIQQLELYDGTSPQNVKTCMETHFGGANSEIASFFISGWLQAIKAGLANQEYTIEQNGTGDCDSNTLAHIERGMIIFESFISITLCDPLHFSTSNSEQTATVIHEGAHIFLSALDLAYIHEDEYSQLNTLQQMVNADAFSEFSRCICP